MSKIKISYILTSTNHGTMILNKNDYRKKANGKFVGVGHKLLEESEFDSESINFINKLLNLRKLHYGEGVIFIDCGANIGTHTISVAKHIYGWGNVISIEAQKWIYYALAGNIAINNCDNVNAHWAAISDKVGTIKIPNLNHKIPSSFASFSIKDKDKSFDVGQDIDYSLSDDTSYLTNLITLDNLNVNRVDLIKIDIEGMEIEAIQGSKKILSNLKPILIYEITKSEKKYLNQIIESYGYKIFNLNNSNCLAIHTNDKCLGNINKI